MERPLSEEGIVTAAAEAQTELFGRCVGYLPDAEDFTAGGFAGTFAPADSSVAAAWPSAERCPGD
jgi:hypothetical protein